VYFDRISINRKAERTQWEVASAVRFFITWFPPWGVLVVFDAYLKFTRLHHAMHIFLFGIHLTAEPSETGVKAAKAGASKV
jgi:hypothetical protein